MAILIGHRGARGLAPENTIAALQAGLDAGVDMLEIDVRVTRDGVPVLHHNKCLQNALGKRIGGKAIAFCTLAELRALRPDLATLEQAITFVEHRVPLMIEVKPHVDIQPIVAVVTKTFSKGTRATDLLWASFSQKTLRGLHTAVPELETIVLEHWSGVRASYRARQLNTKRLAMNRRFLWWFFIRQMAKSGYQLSAYTLNNPAKAARWEKDGLYGVITDYPDRFRRQTGTTTD